MTAATSYSALAVIDAAREWVAQRVSQEAADDLYEELMARFADSPLRHKGDTKMSRSYRVWLKEQVGRVSPSPNFCGTRKEAEAMLRQCEREDLRLIGKLVVR